MSVTVESVNRLHLSCLLKQRYDVKEHKAECTVHQKETDNSALKKAALNVLSETMPFKTYRIVKIKTRKALATLRTSVKSLLLDVGKHKQSSSVLAASLKVKTFRVLGLTKMAPCMSR